MDKSVDPPKAEFSESLSPEALFPSTFHYNCDQTVIIITEDRLELRLNQHLTRVHIRSNWITPCSLLAAFITTLCTSNFHKALGMPASTWQAIFVILALASLVWAVVAIVSAFKSDVSTQNLISEIKKGAQSVSGET